MLNSQLIDTILYLYIGYSFFSGFRRGFFNVIVSIFGIYGACFFSWLFQEKALLFVRNYLNISYDVNPAFIFILLWIAFYIILFVVAKIVTGAVQLKGINLLIRVSGAIINSAKAAAVIVIILTFILSLSDSIYEETDTTKFFTGLGSKLMSLYNKNVDEQQIMPSKQTIIEESTDLIDDDLRYNLLER